MPVIALWRELPPERRALALQLLRYALVGFGVTSVQAAIYWLLATHSGVHSQVANFAGYVAAVVLGYFFGSVAKIVKLEHAWRRLDGRNDDGFQVAPFPG